MKFHQNLPRNPKDVRSSVYDTFSVSRLYSVDDKMTSESWCKYEDKYSFLKRNSKPGSQRPSDQGLRLEPRGTGTGERRRLTLTKTVMNLKAYMQC
jgi:hypothetical protein